MTEAIGQIIGNAAGVMISPLPEIAVVLILFSAPAARNSAAFLAGWLLGLTGLGLFTLVVGLGSNADSDSGSLARLLIGAAFIFLAARKWRSRPPDGEDPEMPAWMERVDGLSATGAFGLAILLTALNPKNIGLTVAAGISISASGLETGQEFAVLMVFVGLASVTVIAPIAYFFLARQRAEPMLESVRVWLIGNSQTLMMVLYLVLGAKLLGDGISGLG